MGMDRTKSLCAAAAAGSLAAVTALSAAGPAGAQLASCRQTGEGVQTQEINNVEAIIDDSASMRTTDPNRLREAGLEVFILDSNNTRKTLGVTEFGSSAFTVFGPLNIGRNRATMINALRARIKGDNGDTDYDAGFIRGLIANRGAEARIFLTDGAHDGPYMNSHRAGPRTFVVGLGIGPASSGDPRAIRLQQIANETGGTYFPRVASATLQPTFRRISAAISCLAPPRGFRSGFFTRAGQKSTRTIRLRRSTRYVDLVTSWTFPGNNFRVSVSMLGRRNRVLATSTGRGRPRKIRTRKSDGRTFRARTMRKFRGARRMRFTVTATSIVRPERTTSQVTQRRRGQ